ncbi:MAG: hypothetical protein LBV57_02990, partial [Candidatus Symbiothrix sp.]|nr:hypothetical protein [Candidatus Symbiothrix sp.]
MKKLNRFFGILLCLVFAVSCVDEKGGSGEVEIPDMPSNRPSYSAENAEWYPGGKNGTVFNANSMAYQQAMPFIDANAELYRAFMRGEHIFEKSFVSTDGQGYSGLGPVYIRKSCIA